MLFNSYTFFLLFGYVLLVHYSRLPWRAKKANLLVSSYLFYSAWNPPFVALLWISTLVDWFAARAIYRSESRGRKRMLVVFSLLVNLGLLGYFKYGGFILESFTNALAAAGVHFHPLKLDVVLPVGISFYTFQTMSYTLDCYRRRREPSRSFLDFALYVSFFPQLVAGPIVRSHDLLPQYAKPRRADGNAFAWGLSLVVLGLFQKNVMADGMLASCADTVFAQAARASPMTAWVGTLAFAGQIYCDFAGYSSVAIGLGLCLGFALPDNFRAPYAATGFSDFWQRWHISLSSWLRDYLYIPLGGNRRGKGKTVRNVLATMLIGGLWHGAAWTFVFWGALHGLYLALERGVRTALQRRAPGRFGKGWRPVVMLLTFGMVCLAWVFFRAQTFRDAFRMIAAMLGMATPDHPFHLDTYDSVVATAIVGGLVATHWILRDRRIEDLVAVTPWLLRGAWLGAMLAAIAMMPGESRAFIYFRF